MRHEITELPHQIDAQLVVFDADMHMHSADHHAPGGRLHFLGEDVISIACRMLLAVPVGERMGRGRKRTQSMRSSRINHGSAQNTQGFARLRYVLADSRADLDLRAQKLRLYLLPVGERFAFLQEL